MVRTKLLLMVIFMLTWVVMLTGPTSAEWFIDLYGGGGFIESNDVSLKKKFNLLNEAGLPDDLGTATLRVRATLRDVKAKDFPTGGMRFGYWFESVPYVGLGLDVFMYDLGTKRQRVQADANADLDVEFDDESFHLDAGTRLPVTIPAFTFPLTAVVAPLELMVRWPLLVNADFPKGRLQPYLTAAPSILFTDEDPEVTLGVKVGTGLAWQFHKHFALFTEYRFTHFSPEVRRGSFTLIDQGGVTVKVRKPKVATDLNTHYVIAGISFRF